MCDSQLYSKEWLCGYVSVFLELLGAVAELEDMEIPMAVDINVVNARPEFK